MKEGHCLGDQVLWFCDRRNVRANVSRRSAQRGTVRALVRAGLGLSLILAMAAQPQRADLPMYRPFRPPKPQRQIAAIWPQPRPLGRAAEALLQVILAGEAPRGRPGAPGRAEG
jgi:LysR family hydrogen peroxide-inducible transcriptional activator